MVNINMEAIEYIRNIPPPFRAIVEELRLLILDIIPDITENLREGVPTYEKGDIICYIKKEPNQHIKFGFFNGTKIPDPDQVLNGIEQDKKYMLITEVGEITEKKVQDLLIQVFNLKK